MSSICCGSRPIEERRDVVLQVGGDGKLAAVQRGVADAVDAFVGHDLQRDEVPPRAGDDDFRFRDLHDAPLYAPPVSSRLRRGAVVARPRGPRKGAGTAAPAAGSEVRISDRCARTAASAARGVAAPRRRRGSRRAARPAARSASPAAGSDSARGPSAPSPPPRRATRSRSRRRARGRGGTPRRARGSGPGTASTAATRCASRMRFKLGDRLGRHHLAGLARDRDLHRLAHEARVGHLLGGDLDDEGAALRADAHEPGLAELDEGLAHRLAADAEPRGDLVLRERLAGRAAPSSRWRSSARGRRGARPARRRRARPPSSAPGCRSSPRRPFPRLILRAPAPAVAFDRKCLLHFRMCHTTIPVNKNIEAATCIGRK